MYRLPPLPYQYDALMPAISADIMRLHHQKHHQTYVDKLNAALEQHQDLRDEPLEQLLERIDELPDAISTAIRDQGGGHYNHSLFWQCMAPSAGGLPSGTLGDAITTKWGSFESFTKEFDAKALGLFGSGWVWLTRDLDIIALPNQDTPIALGMGEPLMGLDIWEHAYYLDYRNRRDEYIRNWWQVVNWTFIEARYQDRIG